MAGKNLPRCLKTFFAFLFFIHPRAEISKAQKKKKNITTDLASAESSRQPLNLKWFLFLIRDSFFLSRDRENENRRLRNANGMPKCKCQKWRRKKKIDWRPSTELSLFYSWLALVSWYTLVAWEKGGLFSEWRRERDKMPMTPIRTERHLVSARGQSRTEFD